jgi:hypothetical protein
MHNSDKTNMLGLEQVSCSEAKRLFVSFGGELVSKLSGDAMQLVQLLNGISYELPSR